MGLWIFGATFGGITPTYIAALTAAWFELGDYMRLASIEIDGYRRFHSRQILHLDTRLVALVGRNEAGKTSILRALETLNTKARFKTEGPSQETSRGLSMAAEHAVLTAKFVIGPTEKAAISHIDEAKGSRWLVLKKLVDGQRKYEIYPKITRDLELRKRLVSELGKTRGLESTFTEVDSALAAAGENELPAEARSLIETLHQSFKESPDEKSTLARLVAALLESESKPDPAASAAQVLQKLVPKFVSFSLAQRTLESQYDLKVLYAENRAVPEALKNICDAAELKLRELYDAGESEDEGKVASIEARANEVIRAKMKENWRQSSVSVAFRLSKGALKILVTDDNSGFESISERSDGLRQFVALFALLMRSEEPNQPRAIVLIDEAESHLHYDAQADLIKMLTKQVLADQVVYTTHSLGCLPEDLGAGIRLVRETGDSSSSIESKFWRADRIGLSPLLFGMGAATMSFVPLRYCVLTEGATDFLLLPTLIRIAIQADALGYLVSPGLAEIKKDEIKIIENDGRKVAFLVDGDKSGEEILTMLSADEGRKVRVFQFRNSKNQKCDLEDFISKKVYVAAINEELARSGKAQRVELGDVPDVMRPAAIRQWFKQRDLKEPNKGDIAYRILDCAHEVDDKTSLLDSANASALRELHEAIVAVLKN